MTTIKGLDAVLANLRGAGAQIAQLLPGPLAAAGEVMADELRSRTPDKTSALADNVVAAVTTNQTGGKVRVGFSQAESADGAAFDKIALWLEYGHTEVNHGRATGDGTGASVYAACGGSGG